MSSKRKADKKYNETRNVKPKRNTFSSHLVLYARQTCVIRATSSDILFSLKYAKGSQEDGYYKFNGLKRNSPLEWEVRFAKHGTAVLIATRGLTKTKIREVNITIKGYKNNCIERIIFDFDASQMSTNTNTTGEFNGLDSFEIPEDMMILEHDEDIALPDFAEPTPLDLQETQLTRSSGTVTSTSSTDSITELFGSDKEVLAYVRKQLSDFYTIFNESSIQNWFWFSLMRGCKKLYRFINFSQRGFLCDRKNPHGQLPLHIILCGDKPQKLARFVLSLMGEAKELSHQDAAGMSPMYLASERDLDEITRELEGRTKEVLSTIGIGKVDGGQYSWAMEQYVRFGGTHVRRFVTIEDNSKKEHLYDVALTLSKYKIFWAVEFGVKEALVELLASGIDVNTSHSPNEIGEQPIHYAAQYGQMEVMEILIQHGARIEAATKQNKLPIHYAAEYGQSAVVKRLLDAGVNVHPVDDEGYQPIHYATLGGHKEIVLALLEKGAQIDESGGRDGVQPIHCAVCVGNTPMVRLLLEKGAKLDAQDARGRHPIHYALMIPHITFRLQTPQRKPTWRGIEELLQLGARLDVQDREGIQLLHMAARSEIPDVVIRLLDHKVPVDIKDRDQKQPIHYAAGADYLIALLLERGAHFNAKTASGKMPIHCAAEYGAEPEISFLMQQGARVDDVDANGRQPIHFATEAAQDRNVKYLISVGARVDARDFEGSQPIHYTARGGSFMIDELIELGADMWAVDDNGLMPIHVAAKYNDEDTLAALVEAGVDPETQTKTGKRPIHFAAAGGAKEVIEWLVGAGVDMNVKDGEGKSPVDYADSFTTITFLTELGGNFTASEGEDEDKDEVGVEVEDEDTAEGDDKDDIGDYDFADFSSEEGN